MRVLCQCLRHFVKIDYQCIISKPDYLNIVTVLDYKCYINTGWPQNCVNNGWCQQSVNHPRMMSAKCQPSPDDLCIVSTLDWKCIAAPRDNQSNVSAPDHVRSGSTLCSKSSMLTQHYLLIYDHIIVSTPNDINTVSRLHDLRIVSRLHDLRIVLTLDELNIVLTSDYLCSTSIPNNQSVCQHQTSQLWML